MPVAQVPASISLGRVFRDNPFLVRIAGLVSVSTAAVLVVDYLFKSTAAHSASDAVPPLPGAQYSFLMRGDCRSFHAIACSRPPLPRTRTFIDRLPRTFAAMPSKQRCERKE